MRLASKNYFPLALITLFLMVRCQPETKKNSPDLSEEIRATEKAFKDDIKVMGVGPSFYKYADSAVAMIRGNDSLITGREGVLQYYSKPAYKNAVVDWNPDFIDVAQSGDLAYSYGKYRWLLTDSAGKQNEFTGRYLTIWKKQRDGTWKYVWD